MVTFHLVSILQGDCVTHSLFALAHGVLCEADLLYTHQVNICLESTIMIIDLHSLQDGEGFLTIDKDRFRELRPEDAVWRLFKFGLLSK